MAHWPYIRHTGDRLRIWFDKAYGPDFLVIVFTAFGRNYQAERTVAWYASGKRVR